MRLWLSALLLTLAHGLQAGVTYYVTDNLHTIDPSKVAGSGVDLLHNGRFDAVGKPRLVLRSEPSAHAYGAAQLYHCFEGDRGSSKQLLHGNERRSLRHLHGDRQGREPDDQRCLRRLHLAANGGPQHFDFGSIDSLHD